MQKNKILIIPSWYPTKDKPTRGIFFKEQAEVLTDRFDFRVLFAEPGFTSKKEYISSKLKRKLTGKELFISRFDKHIPTPPQAIAFKYPNIREFDDRENHNILIKYLETVFENEFLPDWKPDLIHAHSTYLGGILANHIGKKYNIPVMITEHTGPFLLHDFSKFYIEKILDTLKTCDQLSAVSYDKMKIIHMHKVYRNIEVVGNLIEETKFEIKNIKTDKFKILIIASVSYIKDIETFFKAINELIVKNHKEIEVTVIGSGLVTDDFKAGYQQKIAEKYNLLEYCTFKDMVEREKMPAEFQQNHVLVSTSIAEGFQVSVLEAMACGLPVISTANGSFEDIYSPEVGVMVKIKDYKAIADALIKIKTGELKFDAEYIRNYVVERHGNKAFSDRIAKIYTETIQNYTK